MVSVNLKSKTKSEKTATTHVLRNETVFLHATQNTITETSQLNEDQAIEFSTTSPVAQNAVVLEHENNLSTI